MNGCLWALDHDGTAHYLPAGACDPSNPSSWNAVSSKHSFRSLSACPNSVWAVGRDGGVYCSVNKTPIPYLVTEETYENQRWYPVVGFTNKTLPTDCAIWSDINGNGYHPREAISLPCHGWAWVEPWTPDTNENIADKMGWQYAYSFHSTFQRMLFKNSFVRRRRWYRVRRYVAIEKWVKVVDPLRLRLSCIAVGGQTKRDTISVWAIERNGGVVYRQGIHSNNPIGNNWIEVGAILEGDEINQLACSPGEGHIWAVTWDGRILHRNNITSNEAMGNSWTQVLSPENQRVIRVSLGDNSAWCICMDGTVCVCSLSFPLDLCVTKISQSSWVGLLQPMTCISVSPANQVFSLGLDTTPSVYVRSQVSSAEISGKCWKKIQAGKNHLSLQDCHDFLGPNPNKYDQFCENLVLEDTAKPHTIKNNCGNGVELASVVRFNSCNMQIELPGAGVKNDASSCQSFNAVPTEYHAPSSQSEISDSESTSTNEVTTDDVLFGQQQRLSPWQSLSAGALTSQVMPIDWLADNDADLMRLVSICHNYSSFAGSDITSNWRNCLFESLRDRNELIIAAFADFYASFLSEIDKSRDTYVKTGHCKVLSNKCKLIDASYEISQDCSRWSNRKKDTNKLSISFQQQNIEALLDELVLVVPDMDKSSGNWSISIYTESMVKTLSPVKLVFDSMSEQSFILSLLTESLTRLRPPSVHSSRLWAINEENAIYCAYFDESHDNIANMLFHGVEGKMTQVSSCVQNITWALSNDGRAWILDPAQTLCASGQATSAQHVQESGFVEELFENQRHSILAGYITFPGLFSGLFHAWSDSTGMHKRTKDTVRLPSPNWSWACEWTTEINENTDSDGWVYAANFKNEFGKKMRRRDNVRRRSSPVPWIPILDQYPNLSHICVQSSPTHITPVFVWAVTVEGYVLCRMGVDKLNHSGTNWMFVSSDSKIKMISAGHNYKVWAVGTNGQAFIRYCANVEDLQLVSWIEIAPPDGQKLFQIAAGLQLVYALSESNQLYIRNGVCESCPEGNSWTFLYYDVFNINLCQNDVLYAVLNYSDPKHGFVKGVLARKSQNCDTFQWLYGVPGPWKYISI